MPRSTRPPICRRYNESVQTDSPRDGALATAPPTGAQWGQVVRGKAMLRLVQGAVLLVAMAGVAAEVAVVYKPH